MALTARSIRDSVQNVLDYLLDAELAVYANQVSIIGTRVTFNRYDTERPFLLDHTHPGVEQYFSWLTAGAYSAVLYEGSLLQLTYDVRGRRVAAHRLNYVPCPFELDLDLLRSGEGIADVAELYRDGDVLLRTPIRFDFDPDASRTGHPAAHMTINGSDCRIACVAPVHPLRFADFVFHHFHKAQWLAHKPFFETANSRHIGSPVLAETDRTALHLMWDVHSQHSA
ncbi:Uncharacterized conserved protein (DUF2290) [Mycobacteroides abscessus subsp. abscessus]|uniref:DUF2290 domain-containing protein n=1 Tax=Mycobacteroides abscessus TaxID=36809 RepID=UPI00092C9213|nr:DUF2290 domain-containing protein [Mycobacteroides abscessus]SID09507.1 Uncharacterized conserved protein (DUF2290) [Mycobacteroides abscessus subsp. abscessus]SKU77075.1 Uncharacterized conserved protein (DUF2290) [Mycobacteroides abscessus subsp. abscessus]